MQLFKTLSDLLAFDRDETYLNFLMVFEKEFKQHLQKALNKILSHKARGIPVFTVTLENDFSGDIDELERFEGCINTCFYIGNKFKYPNIEIGFNHYATRICSIAFETGENERKQIESIALKQIFSEETMGAFAIFLLSQHFPDDFFKKEK